MEIKDLKKQIEAYVPYNEQEEKDKQIMLAYLTNFPNCLTRENEFGHFTASSWVVNHNRTKVLMAYHNIYQSWSWSGGHADGEANLLQTAIRELQEETGVKNIKKITEGIDSLEVICVNGHEKRGKYVPSHVHLNLTYFFEADETEKLTSKPDENKGIKWINIEDLPDAVTEGWMIKRIYSKLNQKLEKC